MSMHFRRGRVFSSESLTVLVVPMRDSNHKVQCSPHKDHSECDGDVQRDVRDAGIHAHQHTRDEKTDVKCDENDTCRDHPAILCSKR